MVGGEEGEAEGKAMVGSTDATKSGGSGGRVDPKSFVPKKQSYEICECSIHASFALLCFSSRWKKRQPVPPLNMLFLLLCYVVQLLHVLFFSRMFM
jgi:hypothetical protein